MDAMMIFSGLLLVMGMVISAGAGIWFLVIAFKESVLWGLAVLFLPVAGLVFTIMHWSDVWRTVVANLAGYAVCVLAAVVLFSSHPEFVESMARSMEVSAMQQSSGGDGAGMELKEMLRQAKLEAERARLDAAAERETRERVEAAEAALAEQGEAGVQGLIGKSLHEVVRILGEPPNTYQTSRGRTIYLYDGYEVTSADGQTVTDVTAK